MLEEQRRVDESHRCDAKLVQGQIDITEFQVRMGDESTPDLVEVSRIDIDADDSLDGRGVGVFQTVATSDAENGDAVWEADTQGAFERPDRALNCCTLSAPMWPS